MYGERLLRLKAIVLIPRRDGILRLSEAEKIIVFGDWEGFRVDSVPSVRSAPNGWAVGVVMRRSPIDDLIGAFLWFPKACDIDLITEAMNRSDRLTHDMLGHGWSRGPRPYIRLEDFIL